MGIRGATASEQHSEERRDRGAGHSGIGEREIRVGGQMSSIRRGRRIAAGLGAVGLALAVAVSGCSAGENTDRGAATSGGGDAGLADQKGAEGPAGAPAPAQDTPGKPAAPGAPAKFQVDQRAIVYTGSITVRVEKVDEAAASVAGFATAAEGFVGGDKRTTSNGHSRATVTLRVPADRFGAVVDQIAGLGESEQRDIDTEDVTEAIIDVDARIATQQASVNRTRALLARARTIGEIVSLESELTRRESELAALQAKKRRLADLTTLSTITAVLLGPDAEVSGEDEPDTGFVAGLKAGWKAFLASMEVLLTVLGALLPWVIALGVPLYALIWLLRRLGRRSRPAGPPAGPPAPAMAGPATLPPPPTHRTPPPPATPPRPAE
jgi:hypothetical protein